MDKIIYVCLWVVFAISLIVRVIRYWRRIQRKK